MPNVWAASMRLPGLGLRNRSSARSSSAGVRARHCFMNTIVAWRGRIRTSGQNRVPRWPSDLRRRGRSAHEKIEPAVLPAPSSRTGPS